MRTPTKCFATATVGATLALAPMAAPASAAPAVVIGGGLVNVQVVDNEIITDNNVAIGVAAGIAANVCPEVVANVGVLAQQLARGGEFTCTAAADGQQVIIEQIQ